jgi:hypothetical protein
MNNFAGDITCRRIHYAAPWNGAKPIPEKRRRIESNPKIAGSR